MARTTQSDRVFCAVALAAALTALPPCASRAESQSVQAVAARGTELVVALPDGRVLRSADLVGAVLHIDDGGTPRTVRIDAVERGALPMPEGSELIAVDAETDAVVPRGFARVSGAPRHRNATLPQLDHLTSCTRESLSSVRAAFGGVTRAENPRSA